MESHGENQAPSSRWVAQLRSELAALPDCYETRAQAMLAARDAFHRELARALQPTLNSWLNSQLTGDSPAAYRELATRCNWQLHELGLAFRDPNSGQPCKLHVDTRKDRLDEPRFQLHRRDDHGRPHRPLTSRRLPVLTLMPDATSRVGYLKGRER